MSECKLKQRLIINIVMVSYLSYIYLAFVLYMLFHKVFDDEASIVALLFAIPLIIFAVIASKHVE